MTDVVAAPLTRRAHEGAEAFVGAPVRHREEREAELAVTLAPGATRPVGAGVRLRPEAPDPFRLCFERDLDRIKHSRPWRRLAGKCQVFIAPEDDHLRTRLTHAVEVAQVATGIARAANLCLPLIEAIALAHDCGHGPAGHASEEAFSPFLPGDRLRPRGLRRRRHPRAAQPVRGDARRRAQPLVAPARTVDARGRGGGVGRPHRVRLPRLRGRGAGRDPRARRPARRGARRRRRAGRRSRSARSCSRCSTPIDRTGAVGMTEPAASRARRRSGPSTSSGSTCARPRAGRPSGSSACSATWSSTSPTRRAGSRRCATARCRRRSPGSPEAAALAVHYVSGMTDRFALGLGVELLGWRPDDLPRGV